MCPITKSNGNKKYTTYCSPSRNPRAALVKVTLCASQVDGGCVPLCLTACWEGPALGAADRSGSSLGKGDMELESQRWQIRDGV